MTWTKCGEITRFYCSNSCDLFEYESFKVQSRSPELLHFTFLNSIHLLDEESLTFVAIHSGLLLQNECPRDVNTWDWEFPIQDWAFLALV